MTWRPQRGRKAAFPNGRGESEGKIISIDRKTEMAEIEYVPRDPRVGEKGAARTIRRHLSVLRQP
jgi:hypothetical protein